MRNSPKPSTFEEGFADAEEPQQRRGDCVRAEAGQDGHSGALGGTRKMGVSDYDLLPPEEAVRRNGRARDSVVEATRCRSQSR
jgi:hypothetical protein